MSLSQKVDETAEKINGVISSTEKSNHQQIQALKYQLLQILEVTDFSYVRTFHHRHVGVLPCNRNYEMLDPQNVHRLLHKITGKGYDPTLPKPVAQEIGPNAEGANIREKNAELVSKSAGLLAPISVEELHIATAAGSHTTAAVRVADAALHTKIPVMEGCEAIGDDQGYVSQQRILERCPTFQSPMTTGLTYTVVRWQICEKCPLLMETLSEGHNAEHDAFQKETPLQTMYNLHGKAIRLNARTDEEWKHVHSLVCRGHDEEFAKTVSHWTEFVKKYAGGEKPIFLDELNNYGKTLKAKRELSSDFL